MMSPGLRTQKEGPNGLGDTGATRMRGTPPARLEKNRDVMSPSSGSGFDGCVSSLRRAEDDRVFKETTQSQMMICKLFYSPNQIRTTPSSFRFDK